MLDDLHLEVVRLVILRGVLRTVSLSRRREPRRERLENARCPRPRHTATRQRDREACERAADVVVVVVVNTQTLAQVVAPTD